MTSCGCALGHQSAHEIVGVAQGVDLSHVHEPQVGLNVTHDRRCGASLEVEVHDGELVGPSHHLWEERGRESVNATEGKEVKMSG